MAQKKKDGRMASFKIREEILQMLDKYAEETMLSKTAIVEKALINLFAEK